MTLALVALYLIPIAIVLGLFACTKWKLEFKGFLLAITVFIYSLAPDPLSLHDRLSVPTAEVNSITPICVVNQREDLKFKDWPTPKEYALYLVVELQNEDKESSVNKVEISGRLLLSGNDYLVLHSNVGRTLPEIQKEYEQTHPFYRIHWTAWPTDSRGSIRVPPYENRLLVFTLWNFIISGQREEGWRAPREDYVGHMNPKKEATRQSGFPSAIDFLSMRAGNITGLNSNLLKDEIRWQVNINGKPVDVDAKQIRNLVITTDKRWRKERLEKLLYRSDKLINVDKRANKANSADAKSRAAD